MKKITYILLVILTTLILTAKGQETVADRYSRVLDTLSVYLANPVNGSFKEAVYYSEAAFYNNFSFRGEFENRILLLASLAQGWANANHPTEYRYSDSINLNMNYAIYKVLRDTIKIITTDGREFHTSPYEYDFSDFFGRSDWSNMFVSKLLVTQKGNCHSIPFLYKILADELRATCWLGLAPNHIYIKNRCKEIGWYNTELTSGQFPIDAWITASGYIPLKAIQSGIYMDTLSNQHAIALCVLDLAKGYEFQSRNYNDGFILKCCDLVLQYHPVNVQALLLKAETFKRIYEKQERQKDSMAKETYHVMEQLYVKLFELGYREMPEKMYQEWLASLVKEKDKYTNKKLNTGIKPSDIPTRKKTLFH